MYKIHYFDVRYPRKFYKLLQVNIRQEILKVYQTVLAKQNQESSSWKIKTWYYSGRMDKSLYQKFQCKSLPNIYGNIFLPATSFL